MKYGEYVRTKKGIIAKILEDVAEKNICFGIDNKILEYLDNEYCYTRLLYKYKKDILNHSKNIIDLIEVGDYVNGCRVEEIIGNTIMIFGINQGILEEDIRSIVTKEQFKSIEYNMEG